MGSNPLVSVEAQAGRGEIIATAPFVMKKTVLGELEKHVGSQELHVTGTHIIFLSPYKGTYQLAVCGTGTSITRVSSGF